MAQQNATLYLWVADCLMYNRSRNRATNRQAYEEQQKNTAVLGGANTVLAALSRSVVGERAHL